MGGRCFGVVGGSSRWLGWVVLDCKDNSGDRVVVVVAAGKSRNLSALRSSCLWMRE